MRVRPIYILLLLLAVAFTGCKDDKESAGGSVLEKEDQIWVCADTFPIKSDLLKVDSIISMPDSFLLGEMASSYGTLHADILTQFACPIGYVYPEGATVDSVCLCMAYRSWFGDGNSPMGITVYEIDQGEFDYARSYPTNIDPQQYVSSSSPQLLAHEKVVVASLKTDSVYSSSAGVYYPVVRARMSDDFTKRLFDIRDFDSQEAFNDVFKGLYIVSEFGSGTILNVLDINLSVYYTFKYKKGVSDTIVHDVKAFYANSEVRQINCINYKDQDDVFVKLQADADYNYVASPANLYTRLRFPMAKIQERINSRIDGKRPYVNMGKVKIDVDYMSDDMSTRDKWFRPATQMLLIKESALERFFTKRELPTDTCALLADFSRGTDKSGKTEYFYTYDMSALLTNQLRYSNNPDTLDMVLVPVDVMTATSNNTTYVISIKQQQTVSATKTYSAENAAKPMDIEVVYSGF